MCEGKPYGFPPRSINQPQRQVLALLQNLLGSGAPPCPAPTRREKRASKVPCTFKQTPLPPPLRLTVQKGSVPCGPPLRVAYSDAIQPSKIAVFSHF